MTSSLELRVEGGYFKATKSQDPNYPGICVEFVADNDSGDSLSRPTVLFEKPIDGLLRALVWSNKDKEDYSEEITFNQEA